ncbi:MAG: type II toxin-antitoxin system Phd/YefM family antitoxin [Alphaproteobacteria bacterium]|nr:type II toxin-antitoxin system Phd/YefM family antitoxin [Alphaproteobacteria bacterium]
MRNVIATHARAQLLKLLDSVEAGETITIMRRGKAIAVLSPPLVKRQKAPSLAPALGTRRKRVLMTDAEILAAANRPRPR